MVPTHLAGNEGRAPKAQVLREAHFLGLIHRDATGIPIQPTSSRPSRWSVFFLEGATDRDRMVRAGCAFFWEIRGR